MRSSLLSFFLAVGSSFFALAANAEEPLPVAAPVPELVPLPAHVDAVRIHVTGGFGLDHTRENVVRRELGFAEGDVLTEDKFDIAMTRLWNTTIFAHVDVRVVRENGRNVAVIELEDRVTLNPLLGYGVGGNAYYFRVGLSDNNFLGTYLEVDAQYEYFEGFSGGQAIFRNPRLFGERLDALVQVESLARPRPGFSDLRTQAIVEVLRLGLSDRIRTGLRVSAIADSFLPPIDPPTFYQPPVNTLAVEPSLRVGRLDTVRLRLQGASLEVRPSAGFTTSDGAKNYVAMTLDALYYAMLGERWNFAVRVHGADISRVPPVLQLYAGGLDLVRGFPDNYVRGRALLVSNVELRFTAFDSTWLAVMPVGFVDGLVALSAIDGTTRSAASVGAGVRLLIPKFVGTGFRFDFAVPLTSNVEEGAVAPGSLPVPHASVRTLQPSLGVYQFF